MTSRHFAHGIIFLVVAIACGAVIALAPIDAALAQPASMAGTVRDAAGMPLPGVAVTTIPASGGITTRATTESDGAYQLEALPDGTYRVDFAVAGFDLIRRNHVRVRQDATATVDATVPISTICECVEIVPPTPLRQRAGQVTDESSRPLPHARLELIIPARREVAYADHEGRFEVRVPAKGTWPLTASDSGFGALTVQVSGTQSAPIVLRLRHVGATGVPDNERFTRGCRCPGDLFIR